MHLVQWFNGERDVYAERDVSLTNRNIQEERIHELEKQIAELQGIIEELMVKVKPCDLEGLL